MKPNAILRTVNVAASIPGLAEKIQINFAIDFTPGAKFRDARDLEIQLEDRVKVILRQLAEEHAMLQNYNGMEAAG